MYNMKVRTSADSFIVSGAIGDDSSHAYFANAGIYHRESGYDDEGNFQSNAAQRHGYFVRANYIHRGCTYSGLVLQREVQP